MLSAKPVIVILKKSPLFSPAISPQRVVNRHVATPQPQRDVSARNAELVETPDHETQPFRREDRFGELEKFSAVMLAKQTRDSFVEMVQDVVLFPSFWNPHPASANLIRQFSRHFDIADMRNIGSQIDECVRRDRNAIKHEHIVSHIAHVPGQGAGSHNQSDVVPNRSAQGW